MRLQLTDVERLILSNQYEILGLLKKEPHYETMANDLRSGHQWLYQQDFQGMSENMSTEAAEHVHEVLGMFSELKASYEKLTDKTGIAAHDVEFLGFDGNNETEMMAFAQALADRRLYEEMLGKRVKNSHMPTTDLYRRMLTQYVKLGKPRYPMSAATIKQIIAARRHPDAA